MATFHYSGQAVVANDDILEGATGGTFVDASGTNIPIYDLNDNPIGEITSNKFGLSSSFKADVPMGYVKFGEVLNRVFADEVAQFAVDAQDLGDDVALALAQSTEALDASQSGLPSGGTPNVDILWAGPVDRTGVWAPPPTSTSGGASDWDSITNKPTTFPPSGHTHTSGQLSDSSTVGRAVLTAADAQTARAVIGAGTGNGTSNLTLGTTATTAAAGNHSHVASAVPFAPAGSLTATNVQTAIEQAATMGGAAGSSQVLVWEYASGAWPALSATQPSNVRILWALGPTYPTTVPSWVGLGAGKVRLRYSKLALA